MSEQIDKIPARRTTTLLAWLFSVILWFYGGGVSVGQTPDLTLPDLIVTDIFFDNNCLFVKYMNVGAAGTGDFHIRVSDKYQNNIYTVNSEYPFTLPAPKQEMTTEGIPVGSLGLKIGMNISITAEIDWENRIKESNKNNNIFQKQLDLIPPEQSRSVRIEIKRPVAIPPSSDEQTSNIDLPDLIVTDIAFLNTAVHVNYMNIGAAGKGDFLIKLSANGKSFPGYSSSRLPVPEPGYEIRYGNLTPAQIGLNPGATVVVTAEIDWENRVNERNKANNIFQKEVALSNTNGTASSKQDENAKFVATPLPAAKPISASPPATQPSQKEKKVVDNDFNPAGTSTVNAVFSGTNANQEWAQTFTVGKAGILTEIDVFIRRFPPTRGKLWMDLRRTGATGDPTSDSKGIIASVSADAGSVPADDNGFVAFDIASSNILVSPGEKYAIALRAGEDASTFKWLGLTGNPYAGGGAFDRQTSDEIWANENGSDLGIRTYISPPTKNVAAKPNAVDERVSKSVAAATPEPPAVKPNPAWRAEPPKPIPVTTRASNPVRVEPSLTKLFRLEPRLAPLSDRAKQDEQPPKTPSKPKTGAERLASLPLTEQDRTNKIETLRIHLQGGDSRAAVVVTVKPLLVAAYTDELDCVALLQYPDWLTQEFDLKPGSRLLTVNMYSTGTAAEDLTKGPKELKRYGNFYPIIADFVTDDQERVRKRKAEISEDEWTRCADFGKKYLERDPLYVRNGSPLQSVAPGKPVDPATIQK
jgi:hypothetical protein